jgi:predicted metal-dependent HD superfamily phosphohydrolase
LDGGPSPALVARYAEPHRRYHTWGHIQACLDELSGLHGLSDRDREVLRLAIWWHDAVYDPRRSDDEEQSAELARRELAKAGTADDVGQEVARLILLTKGHEVGVGDRLGALLVSIDLSILGADPKAYADYSAAVREEYEFVPEEAFRAGRAAILARFLQSRRIFPHEDFAERLEAQARANLTKELSHLRAAPAGQ